jgi:hypothetical protein
MNSPQPFPTESVVIDTDTLDLPFWLFRLEEFSEVLFRGRPAIAEEVDVLRDLIPEAKKMFKGATDTALIRRAQERSSLTADTPVPYRVADLLALIDERIGKLEGRSEKPHLRSLKVRLLAAVNDPRYEFMFSSNTIHDTILTTISHIFRIPGGGKPVTTFQLAGIPSEVVNSVASILCRMAFEIALWSAGGVRILVVCEEAHRYVPADPKLGFFPTRQAIARIAKEGRKYGVSLGVITQRPGELDPTILSQCSTVFAMRLSNDRDQDIIRSAIPDSSASTMSFLSSIGNGEAIAFGEAVAVPMRMVFERVSESVLPRANSGLQPVHRGDATGVDLRQIVMRMRHIDDSGGADAVAALALGFIELPVGTTVELVATFPAIPDRDAGADCHAKGDIAALDSQLRNRLADPVSQVEQLALGDVGGEDGEFFSTEPRHHIVISGKDVEAFGNPAQDFVTDIMPVGVIHRLEVIEIENHHTDRLVDGPECFEVFAQRFIEIAPVEHTGHGIGDRCVFEGLRADREGFGHFPQLALLAQAPRHEWKHQCYSADNREPGKNSAHKGKSCRRFCAANNNAAGGSRKSCPRGCAAEPDQTDQQDEEQLCLVKTHDPYKGPNSVKSSLPATPYVCFNAAPEHETCYMLTCNS